VAVAVITTSWPQSAADPSGHFVRSEVREIERSGATVVVIAAPPGGAFGWPGVAARLQEDPRRAIDAARWVVQATSQVARLRLDRAVCHWALPSAWPIACVGTLATRCSIEIVSHGSDVRLLAALPPAVKVPLTRTMARRCESWRFVSSDLLATLLSALDARTASLVERVAVVGAARIELPDLPRLTDAVARRRSELRGARTAVSVGRLVASKRVDRAITHVAGSPEFDALVVIGDGPERPRLEELARATRAPARFVGAVPRPDALAWIGAADALIHASTAEGLSTVIREAEALGTRVVRI
jgi:glycosyltransferase involved in cell wall biosynthesis